MFKNLLIVEDDPEIRKLLVMYFKREEYNIYEAEDGEEALELFSSQKMDLVILDIMIPFIDGYSVCRHIHAASKVPVIMLTARTDEGDILKGFDEGADEYVTKPFSPKVLVARAKAILGRTEGNSSSRDQVFSSDGLVIDFASGRVTADNREIVLTHKEYELLVYLVHNKGSILNKESILDRVWGYDYFGEPRTLDTHIRRLREKLDDKSRYIITIRGRGYKFDMGCQ